MSRTAITKKRGHALGFGERGTVLARETLGFSLFSHVDRSAGKPYNTNKISLRVQIGFL